MKAYDDFDRAERFAYGKEPGEEKKVNYEKRIYELSLVERPKSKEFKGELVQFPFRHLCNVLQIHEGDLAKVEKAYSSEIKSPADRAKLISRSERAWKWVTTFAPEEFRFQLQTDPQVKTKYPEAISELVLVLKGAPLKEEGLTAASWEIMKKHQIEGKAFFQDIYQILVKKNNGPRLASFLLAIGQERSAKILEKSLPQ